MKNREAPQALREVARGTHVADAARMRLVVLALLALPALAAAQPGPDDPTPPGMTPPVVPARAVPPPPSGLELADQRDAAADRAFGSSTALVVPRGTADVSIRAGSGVLDTSVALGLGGGLELSADYGRGGNQSMAGAALKVGLVREGMFGLAIEGGFHSTNNQDSSTPSGTAWSTGAAASLCSDSSCAVLLSGTAGIVGDGNHSGTYATGSVLFGTGGFRPMLEVAVISGESLEFLGVRMGGRNASVDVGIAAASDEDGGAVIPLFGLTVRP